MIKGRASTTDQALCIQANSLRCQSTLPAVSMVHMAMTEDNLPFMSSPAQHNAAVPSLAKIEIVIDLYQSAGSVANPDM